MMKTLVLNLDGTPLSVVTKRRAIKLMLNCKFVTALSFYDEYIKSETQTVRVPAVILYNRYVKFERKNTYPSKRMIYNRDQYTCQYCESKLNENNLTIDHVIPISRFSCKKEANTWENMVACCKKCNTKKGNRLIQEVNMKLSKTPKKETLSSVISVNIPNQWKDYVL